MRGLKRTIIILVFMLSGAAMFAAESDFFVKTVPITKVFLHRDGFRIVYLKSDLNFGVFYVPMSWFGTTADSKAEAVYGTDKSYPYFSIFYKEGEFHHIRFYLEENRRADSWDDLPNTDELKARFQNVDTLELEF